MAESGQAQREPDSESRMRREDELAVGSASEDVGDNLADHGQSLRMGRLGGFCGVGACLSMVWFLVCLNMVWFLGSSNGQVFSFLSFSGCRHGMSFEVWL